jgi:hypothetical protein
LDINLPAKKAKNIHAHEKNQTMLPKITTISAYLPSLARVISQNIPPIRSETISVLDINEKVYISNEKYMII